MRTIETAAAGGHERARLAFDLFCYVLAKAIAALVVPSAGWTPWSSRAASARTRSPCASGRWRTWGSSSHHRPGGQRGARAGQNGRITEELRPQALVVPTNEELMIAWTRRRSRAGPEDRLHPCQLRRTRCLRTSLLPGRPARRIDDRVPRPRARPRSPGRPRRVRQAHREPRGQPVGRADGPRRSHPARQVGAHPYAEELLAAGDDQTLMEHVVEVAGKAGLGADVLIVEG